MRQSEVEAKLAELELCISILTDGLGMLSKTVNGLQDNMLLLVGKMTEALKTIR